MSIWCDGTDLYLYRGDSAALQFSGLPGCLGYRVYFSVKSIRSKEIIFECGGDPEYYYVNNDGEEYVKKEDESEYDFIKRMEALVESGDAIKRGRCKIFVSSDKTEKLWLLKTEEKNTYYYGLKICFAHNGVENTIIPKHSSSMKGYVSASIFRDFNFSLKFPKLLRFLDFPFIVL